MLLLRGPNSTVIHLEHLPSSAQQFPPYLLPVIFNIALLLCTTYECRRVSLRNFSRGNRLIQFLPPPPLSLSVYLSLWYHLFLGISFFWHSSLVEPNPSIHWIEGCNKWHGLRIKWQKTEMDVVEFSNWMVADYDRSVSVSCWMVGNQVGRFSSRESSGQKGEMNESGHEALRSRYRGQCSGGEGIDFRGVHTNIEGYRKKRVARRPPWEAIIKQQVVASSRKFMSDARCGTIHRFELNFWTCPCSSHTLFANPPFPIDRPPLGGNGNWL